MTLEGSLYRGCLIFNEFTGTYTKTDNNII
jgi:hypothetical protein